MFSKNLAAHRLRTTVRGAHVAAQRKLLFSMPCGISFLLFYIVWFNYRCPFCGCNNVKLFFFLFSISNPTKSSPQRWYRKHFKLYVQHCWSKLNQRIWDKKKRKKFNSIQNVCFMQSTEISLPLPHPLFYMKLFCCSRAKNLMKVQKQHSLSLSTECNLNNLM